MSNNYFQFKQFRVEQDLCAMKVSTDGCIQGAWAPLSNDTNHVLDIGAGTGLLSLMLAQRYSAIEIDALEIDADAASQAVNNVAISPFADRIVVMTEDAKTFTPEHNYDFIICNPPFFKQSLLGADDARNMARHHISLRPEDLVELLKRALGSNGQACFMWPQKEHLEWVKLLKQNGFYFHKTLEIQDRKGSRITRVISIAGREMVAAPIAETLIIKAADGTYTDAFKALLAPFYLFL